MAKKNDKARAKEHLKDLEPGMQEAFANAEAFIKDVEKRNESEPRAGEVLRGNLDVTLSFRLGALDRRMLTELAHLEGKKTSDLAREIMLEGLAMRQMRHELFASAEASKQGDEVSAEQLVAALAQISGPIQAVAALSSSTLGLLSGLQNAAMKRFATGVNLQAPRPAR